MVRRKIQLIAGRTYSVSLPKEWIIKNKLRAQEEIQLVEQSDRSLVIRAHGTDTEQSQSVTICVDPYKDNIHQLLFTLYYLGVEHITLFSKQELTKEAKSKIRKSLQHMSGTEISHEDDKKIEINVFIHRSKVDLLQLIYRIVLIIDSTNSSLHGSFDFEEIQVNEDEVDRLYHLISKLISLSLIDTNVLHSSNIRHVSLIPYFFLISKKLESVADSLYTLASYKREHKVMDTKVKLVTDFVVSVLQKINNHLRQEKTVFSKTPPEQVEKINKTISAVKDHQLHPVLQGLLRNVADIEGELVNITIFNTLQKNDEMKKR